MVIRRWRRRPRGAQHLIELPALSAEVHGPYDRAALADVLPAALAALGVEGEANALDLPRVRCVVVLLVDGLGWTGLQRCAGSAPFLTAAEGHPIAAGFPTTTVTSITSLGVGVPSGRHGLVGLTTWEPTLPGTVNWLPWTDRGGRDLSDRLPPKRIQPMATAFERARAAGVPASVVSAAAFRGSGLTRAALRGADFHGVLMPAETVVTIADLARRAGGLVYGYLSELDLVGHLRGCGSSAWATELALVDRTVELLAARLPADCLLLVTGDHGMVDVPDDAKVDLDSTPALTAGVEVVAGEARVRYLHLGPGQLSRVRDTWEAILGSRVLLLDREEILARGWYGRQVTEAAAARIGDLVAIATGRTAFVRRRREPRLAAMIGHHGALTEDELLVPLLRVAGRAG